jgi:subtilisin family serine protease
MFNQLKIKIGILTLFFSYASYGQKPNWQNLDLKTDSVFGISTEKTYLELLKGKTPVQVIVAVIDAGIDTTHEDLKPVLWHNLKEKPGNYKDNDHNGYANDIYGWNFIGSAKGNVDYDNMELTRQVRQLQSKYANCDTAKLPASDLAEYHNWEKERSELDNRLKTAGTTVANINRFYRVLDTILNNIGTREPTIDDLQSYEPKNERQGRIVKALIEALQHDTPINAFLAGRVAKDLKHAQDDLDYHLNLRYDPRSIVGDDYNRSNQKYYGNADITGPNALHGSHVAGIIAASRNNGIGINGVADDVKVMGIRAVPDGDERDKDVANAIRYAVDNGAKVINMSFGKPISPGKKAVDDAVKYAMSKDVLLIHAAGNDNKDLDSNANFPNRTYADGSGIAQAWIEVGASGWKYDKMLKAPFSNYGKNTVDVFAPGVHITSTVPGSKYEALDGTSMAAPVVTGLAALIREYYPQLTAVQVKDIILKSVVKVNHHVFLVKGNQPVDVLFSDLCSSGGIINAYQALQMAANYK